MKPSYAYADHVIDSELESFVITYERPLLSNVTVEVDRHDLQRTSSYLV